MISFRAYSALLRFAGSEAMVEETLAALLGTAHTTLQTDLGHLGSCVSNGFAGAQARAMLGGLSSNQQGLRAACWNAGMNPKPGQKHLTNEELKALNGRELTILANEAAVARSLSNSLGKRHYGSAESSATLWQSVAMCRDIAFAKVLALSVAVPRGVLFFIVPFAQPGWHPKTSGVLRALLRANGKYALSFFAVSHACCRFPYHVTIRSPSPHCWVSCQCNILKKSRRLALFWTCQTSTLAGSLAKLLPCR